MRAPLLLNGLSPLSVLFSPPPQLLILCQAARTSAAGNPNESPLLHRSGSVYFYSLLFLFFFNAGSIILQPAEVFLSCFPLFVRQSVLSMNQSQCCQLSRETDQNLIMFSGCCCCCCAVMRLYCLYVCVYDCVFLLCSCLRTHADRHTSDTRNKGKGKLCTKKTSFSCHLCFH